MGQTVAIFGATGAQGAPVVKRALASGLSVRAIARDIAKVSTMHPGAKATAADLSDSDAIAAALAGVDAAFLHLPMPQHPDDPQTWLKAFITAAHAAKLPLVVYSTSGPAGDKYPSSMVVDGGTAAAGAVAKSGISAIILKPAIYLENLLPPIFMPRLRAEGIADYPPLRASQRVMWTSHQDQARLAVAALTRPELAGQAFDVASPGALRGTELAALLSAWLGRSVGFDPLSPGDFGTRVADALGNPGIGMALADLYGALAKMPDDGMLVDTDALEQIFGVTLTPVSQHIRNWPTS